MKPFTALAALATLALAACAPEYAYLPVTNATIVGNNVAAEYPIPADLPHGDVLVTSYGIVDVAPRGDPNQTIRSLHLRFTITNNAGRPWQFDAREQRVELPGYGSSVPAFASSNAGTPPPMVTVPSLEKRVVDLFFPLPAPLQHASRLPSFDVVWRLNAADRFVSRRTTFERVELVPPPDYYGPYDYGADYWWGPPYWYNPAYGSATFVGGTTLPPRYYSRSVGPVAPAPTELMNGREHPAEPTAPQR